MAADFLNNEKDLAGRISHYFGNIGVAVVDLKKSLKEGDAIRIVGGTTDFTQTVGSMEKEHQKVSEAEAGDSVGMKIEQRVKDGYKIYKVS